MAKQPRKPAAAKAPPRRRLPAEQGAGAREVGPGKPPPEHRFKPGESGNPKGRPPNAGATLREWVNQLAADELTEVQLRAIRRDRGLPWPKRVAAGRILRLLEVGDVRDFEPWLRGKASLGRLSKAGVNTELVKRVMIRPGEHGEARSIELHDRAGEEFDRLVGHTDGRPTQRVEAHVDHTTPRTPAEGEAAAAALLAGIAQRLGADRP